MNFLRLIASPARCQLVAICKIWLHVWNVMSSKKLRVVAINVPKTNIAVKINLSFSK
jgi:hypothetical protein